MSRRSKFKPEMLAQVQELGATGYAVTDACKELGIDTGTFIYWERSRPDFKRAAAKVRLNSEKWKARRFEKLLEKGEGRLLMALRIIRERKEKERQKANAKIERAEAEYKKNYARADGTGLT